MIIDYWFIVEAVISLKYIHDKNDTFLIVLKRARNKIILQQLLHPIYRRFELLNSSVAVVWKLCGLIEAILLLAWVDSDKRKNVDFMCNWTVWRHNCTARWACSYWYKYIKSPNLLVICCLTGEKDMGDCWWPGFPIISQAPGYVLGRVDLGN